MKDSSPHWHIRKDPPPRESALRVLPPAFSLVGTNGLPPIDNQGGIGSCASQAITYMQTTNGFYRYLQSCGAAAPVPREEEAGRFAPRFTFNFSGAGTAWVYETLRDHGCLRLPDCPFEKDEKGASQKTVDGKVARKSAAWPTGHGQMKKALRTRVKGWEQIWFTKPPYNEALTTTPEGRGLLRKIKASLLEGNAVVTGGYPARWVYGRVKGGGSYGKPGQSAVVASAGSSGGGHQVTIVGYDDDITAEIAGVTLRGAFLIANSYGTLWQNDGYVFMMYDAVNTVSEYPALNNPELFAGPLYLTPGEGNRMLSPALTKANQSLRFTAAGEMNIAGVRHTLYDIFDPQTKQYLAYCADPSDRSVCLVGEPGERTKWALIPYEELRSWEGFSPDEHKESFAGSRWIWAAGRGDEPEGGARFLDAGVNPAASGRGVGLATLNSGKYPQAKSWAVEGESEDEFTGHLSIAVEIKAEDCARVWSLDQFCFTDWRRDYVRGLPTLYAVIEIEAKDRGDFLITMNRTERESGAYEREMPPLFRYRDVHPGYCKKDEKISFSGKVNGEPEVGEFALSFGGLLDLPAGRDWGDYTWGFEVETQGGATVTVKSATLYFGGSETPLAAIKGEKLVKHCVKFKF